jgi:hypothetical protein
MSFDLDFDDDLAQRRIKRLENRQWRAQTALASARTYYGSLRELPTANALQLHYALQQVERAQRDLADIQLDLDLAAVAAKDGQEKQARDARGFLLLW